MAFTEPSPRLVSRSTALDQLRRADAARLRHDFDVAGALYQALTQNHPDMPEPWHFHGIMLHAVDQDDAALTCLERARRLAPDNPGFLADHGRVLLDMNKPRRACELLHRARQLRPQDSDILIALTRGALMLQAGGQMIGALEHALERDSDNWQLWLALGNCREQIGNRSGALAALTEAVLFAPEEATAPHVRRGLVALNAQADHAAHEAYSALLRKQPQSAEARLGLAVVAARAGHFKYADTLAREALERNSRLYPAWSLLASLRKGPDAEFDAELERAVSAARDDPDAIPLYFARGQSLERLGEYDRAFLAYAHGNREQSRKAPYVAVTETATARNMIHGLDAQFLARSATVGLPEARPIFIFGMPRSGTTLVEAMIASHPDVSAGGEMRYIHDRLLSLTGPRGLARIADWLRACTDEALRELAHGWLQALDQVRGERLHVTDKMPGNYAWLGLIHVCFPNARLVHVRRDPRDTCLSCYATMFQESYNFSYDLAALGHYYRLYEASMAHWRRALGAHHIIEVEYETLIERPEAETRRLIAALDMDWAPACLEFHKARRSVSTASLHQVRQPLYSSSIGRWRHFEAQLGPLLTALAAPLPL